MFGLVLLEESRGDNSNTGLVFFYRNWPRLLASGQLPRPFPRHLSTTIEPAHNSTRNFRIWYVLWLRSRHPFHHNHTPAMDYHTFKYPRGAWPCDKEAGEGNPRWLCETTTITSRLTGTILKGMVRCNSIGPESFFPQCSSFHRRAATDILMELNETTLCYSSGVHRPSFGLRV
jgi:hypothetical protein